MLQFFLFRIRVILYSCDSLATCEPRSSNCMASPTGMSLWYIWRGRVPAECIALFLSRSSLTHGPAMILSPLSHRNLVFIRHMPHQGHEVQTPLLQFIDLHLDCILLRMVFFWVKKSLIMEI